MSFEERSAWIQMAVLVWVSGDYFLTAHQMFEAGVMALPAYMPLMVRTVVFLVILMIAGVIVALAINHGDDSDERDRLIAWKAKSRSSWILAFGVLAGVTAMVREFEPVLVAHFLLGSLVLSEMLKLSMQILSYRRGI